MKQVPPVLILSFLRRVKKKKNTYDIKLESYYSYLKFSFSATALATATSISL
jgi:hypothetical protein